MTPNTNLKNSIAPFRQPQAPKLYTGPPVPTAYDPQWRTYTNLTPAQIDAFKSMPETLMQVARDLRHAAILGAQPKITPDMTLAQVQAAFDTAKAVVAAPFATEQSVLANIGRTVKTQSDVEAAFNPKK
jgi:hypothetical protein